MTQAPSRQPREPILRAPLIIPISLIVLTAIYLATLLLPFDDQVALIETYGLVPANVAAAWQNRGFDGATLWALVPFVTFAFLHGSFSHLAFNGFAFLIFGTVVARRVGTLRFLGLGLAANFAAAAAHLAVHWGDPAPVIGASGAIAGYMGAASRFMFYDPSNPPTGPGHRLPLTAGPVVRFALVWTVINIAFGVTGFSPDGTQVLAAWEAHLGGFAAGLVLFPLFDRRRNWL